MSTGKTNYTHPVQPNELGYFAQHTDDNKPLTDSVVKQIIEGPLKAMEPALQQALTASEPKAKIEPFKDPKFECAGPGSCWKISDDRQLGAFPGTDGGIILVYKREGRETCVRLSREAAIRTLMALQEFIGGCPPFSEIPKAC